MNLHKRGLFLVVCVAAAAVLSGCFPAPTVGQPASPDWSVPSPATPESPSSDDNETFVDIDITRPMHDNPHYDEWVNWTSGRDEVYADEVAGLLSELGTSIGVSGLESPSDHFLDGGWIGVAPFGDYCIVAVNAIGPEAYDQGIIAVSILSRINLEAEVLTPATNDYAALTAFTAHYESWCDQGGPFPGPPPGTDLDVTVEDQPDTTA